jgi:hypothetical protein
MLVSTTLFALITLLIINLFSVDLNLSEGACDGSHNVALVMTGLVHPLCSSACSYKVISGAVLWFEDISNGMMGQQSNDDGSSGRLSTRNSERSAMMSLGIE